MALLLQFCLNTVALLPFQPLPFAVPSLQLSRKLGGITLHHETTLTYTTSFVYICIMLSIACAHAAASQTKGEPSCENTRIDRRLRERHFKDVRKLNNDTDFAIVGIF